MTGTNDQEENTIQFFRTAIEEGICVDRPIFSSFIKRFFPEWNLTVDETPVEEETPTPSWKAGFLKSTAPYKRHLSRIAAQSIKGPVGKGVNQRYDALNTTNANTIEFRMFKGTMNGTSIMRYLEFVDAMVRFVAATNATNDGLHYKAFVRWLQGDSFNIARYEHLVSFITENGFLDRKEIRRQKLPVVLIADKDCEGLVACEAEGFKELKEVKPIGTFSFAPPEPSEVPAMSEEEATEQYDIIPEPDFEFADEESPVEDTGAVRGCNCSSCRRNRGEIE
jgi:hypothetical protein